MSSPIAYGIDFGTTNSSIAVAYTDRPKPKVLRLSQSTTMPHCMPSIVYLHREGISLAGEEALDRYTITGSQMTRGYPDSRLIFEIKTALTTEGRAYHKLPDYIAVILRTLKEKADQHTGRAIDKAVIGHPVAFAGATGPDAVKLNKLAKRTLKEAACRSGFAEVELYPEPAAAVLGEVLEDGITITVDFGGGTFDVAVVKTIDGEGEVLSLQGAEVGGSLFDELIFDKKLTDPLGLNIRIGHNSLPVPYVFRSLLRGRRGFNRLIANNMTPIYVSDIRIVNPQAGKYLYEVIFGGQAGRFYSAIENAKISLADQTDTYIDYDSADLEFRIPLRRDEFNQWITPYIDTVQATIQRAMNEADISHKDVNTIIRTGGSSQLVAFTEMLNEMFGPEKVLSRDALATVAYGLGVQAQSKWASSERDTAESISSDISPSEPHIKTETEPLPKKPDVESEGYHEEPDIPTPKEIEEDPKWRPWRTQETDTKDVTPIRRILPNLISKVREMVFRRRKEALAPSPHDERQQPISDSVPEPTPLSAPDHTERPTGKRIKRMRLPGEVNDDSQSIPEPLPEPGTGGQGAKNGGRKAPPVVAVPPPDSGPPISELPDGWDKAVSLAEARGHTLGPHKSIPGATMGSRDYYAFCTKCKKRVTASYIWPERLPESEARWRYGGDALDSDCPQP